MYDVKLIYSSKGNTSVDFQEQCHTELPSKALTWRELYHFLKGVMFLLSGRNALVVQQPPGPESYTVPLECALRLKVSLRHNNAASSHTLIPFKTCSTMGLSALCDVTSVTWYIYIYVIINYCVAFKWSTITSKMSSWSRISWSK